jgi:hypothetical protein
MSRAATQTVGGKWSVAELAIITTAARAFASRPTSEEKDNTVVSLAYLKLNKRRTRAEVQEAVYRRAGWFGRES